MTENGKIYFVKNTIMNFLAQQQFSVGLSLYIIKDIQDNLKQIYNKIIKEELQQEEKEQSTNQSEIKQQNFIPGAYPISWTPAEEENEENEDQAD